MLSLIILLVFGYAQAQIVINEVKENGSVELKNLGGSTVDISTYWLCDFPSYRQLNSSTITVPSGSLNLAAGAIVEIAGFDFIDSADGELGLYATNDFNSSSAIVDYIQWGSGRHRRASVAVSAGVWNAVTRFIPAFDANLSIQYSGTGNNPNAYFEATDTLGRENNPDPSCEAFAANITINTRGLNNTTTVTADGLSAVICIDNQSDPIDIRVASGSIGTNRGFIVTDASNNQILGLSSNNHFNLNGAGTGICEIWYVRYENDFGGNRIGNTLDDLTGCFDLSNPVRIIREAADAGTIAIDAAATGNPNNTTSIAADGLSAVICIDGSGDPLVVTHDNPGATNLSYRYVITNEDASEILNITNSRTIDLSVAGTGTCQIWGWSYRGLADNGASFIGGPLSALRAVETCSDVSTMSITVIREAADAGTIAIDAAATTDAKGTTIIENKYSATIIAGDHIANPLVVTHDNPGATNLSYRYVITNEDASEILNITNSNTIDLEGAGTGTCQIWGWSYRGLADNGASFIGGPLSALRAVETCSDVSTMSITVIREAAIAPAIISPENDEMVRINNNPNTSFEVKWSASRELNKERLVYIYQLATDANFKNFLVNSNVGTRLSFVSNNREINKTLEKAGLANRGSVTLYQRVVASDSKTNAASATVAFKVTRDTTLSTNAFESISRLNVYPNPTRDFINISNLNSGSRNVSVQLFDLRGNQLYQNDSKSNNSMRKIDMSTFPEGVYLLKLIDLNSNKAIIKKIFKK